MTKQIQKASSPTRVFPKKFEFDGSISENGRPGGTCGVLEERDEAPVCGGKPPHSSSSRTQSHQPEQINQPIGTRNEPTLRPNTQSGPSGGRRRSEVRGRQVKRRLGEVGMSCDSGNHWVGHSESSTRPSLSVSVSNRTRGFEFKSSRFVFKVKFLRFGNLLLLQ